MNTAVTRGRGEMIVTGTGMDTEMGRIADLLNRTEADKTPLQKQLDRLTLIIAGLAGLAFIAMLILGAINDQDFDEVFLAGVALAISAIPTGMPAVVTTLYSMGTRVLRRHNAIVKRLPVGRDARLGLGDLLRQDRHADAQQDDRPRVHGARPEPLHGHGRGLQHPGRSCCTTAAGSSRSTRSCCRWRCAPTPRLDGEALIGDPTEGALIVLAEKGGISVDGARARFPRIAEVPFDSEYKFMATFHEMTDAAGQAGRALLRQGRARRAHRRAAPTSGCPTPSTSPITDENRQLALDENDRMAKAGERVMVVARRDFDPATFDPNGDLLGLVNDLTLLAMVGIVDPPRPEASDAIAECKSAGIQVRMITGDHAVTAAAIGRELGIDGRALTGARVRRDRATRRLLRDLPDIGVIARVAPEDKIRLVHLLQRAARTSSP